MPGKSHARSEQKALRFSLYGIIGFVVLAAGFAVLTNSDAILFDGIYSLIAFCVTLLTIKVAKLAERVYSRLFHRGLADGRLVCRGSAARGLRRA